MHTSAAVLPSQSPLGYSEGAGLGITTATHLYEGDPDCKRSTSPMSGSAVATSDSRMLAISLPPVAPHSLPQHVFTSSLSMLPPEENRPSKPLLTTKKPKLSLQTSDLASTFQGSVSRQTGINPDATATPTTFNTFNNTFDLTYRPSPVSTLPSPGPSLLRRASIHQSPTARLSEQPYHLNLPFGVYPILKNSPIPRNLRRTSFSASPRIPGRKVFFPAAKKVSFRCELEDEIVTQEYVIRNVDLSSSEDESTPSEADEQSSTSNDEEDVEGGKPTILVDEVASRSRGKRKSVAISRSPATDIGRGTGQESRSTPVRRTKRKRRRWEWTLRSERKERNSEEVSEEGNADLVFVPGEQKNDAPARPKDGIEATHQVEQSGKTEVNLNEGDPQNSMQ